jgi:elongation factor P
MIEATDLKNGKTFLYNDRPFKVVRYSFQKIGRGGATVKLSAKDLISGALEEMSFSSNVKFDEVNLRKRSLQYLYKDGSSAYFMDPTTYDQIEMDLSILGDDIKFLKEGGSAGILFWDEKPLSVELPPKMVFKVKEASPGIKGNSASNMYKPAKLENGIELKVPLFIKVGDKIRVDTRNGQYVERVT